jgi:hypothetical protein
VTWEFAIMALFIAAAVTGLWLEFGWNIGLVAATVIALAFAGLVEWARRT